MVYMTIMVSHQSPACTLCDCCDLLPQHRESIVRDTQMQQSIVDLLLFSLNKLIEALKKFNLDEFLVDFDPHVGDTACQIRAYQLYLLAQRDTSLPISSRCQSLEIISHQLSTLTTLQIPLHNHQWTLESFLRDTDCYFTLSEDELFLFRCYILSYLKRSNPSGDIYISYDQVTTESGCSRKISKKFIRHHQIGLAEFSSKSVIDWAKEIYFSDLDILEASHEKDDDNRPVLPCYLFTKVLYEHLQQRKCPVLLIVNHSSHQQREDIPILFQDDHHKGIPIDSESRQAIKQTMPCVVIEGVCQNPYSENTAEFVERINQMGLRDLLLANMASHPQYSGQKLTHLRENPFAESATSLSHKINSFYDELEYFRHVAYKSGCCTQNRSLFFIEHIFYDSLRLRLEKVLLRKRAPDSLRKKDYKSKEIIGSFT